MTTLYSYPLAFQPGKVLLALAELGRTDVLVKNIDLFDGSSLRPGFMRINPSSTVPVLVVNEVCTYFKPTVIKQRRD